MGWLDWLDKSMALVNFMWAFFIFIFYFKCLGFVTSKDYELIGSTQLSLSSHQVKCLCQTLWNNLDRILFSSLGNRYIMYSSFQRPSETLQREWHFFVAISEVKCIAFTWNVPPCNTEWDHHQLYVDYTNCHNNSNWTMLDNWTIKMTGLLKHYMMYRMSPTFSRPSIGV